MFTTLIKLLRRSTKASKPLPALLDDPLIITAEISDNCVSWTEIDQTFSEMLMGVESLVSGQMLELEKSSLASIHEQYLKNTMPEHLVPRLPAVVPQLMHALRDSESNASDIADLISGDVALVHEVIRLANSAYYSRSQFYDSLEQAIVNIGFNGIRQIIISAAMMPILNTSSGHFSHIANAYLWDKSMYAGLLSDCAASKIHEDRFHAYLASLTMQSGINMLSHDLDKYFNPDNAPCNRQFVDTLNHYALEISVRISEQWQFPEAITDALREQVTIDDPSMMSNLGAIIYLSDKLSKIHLLTKNAYLKTFDTDVTQRMPARMKNIFSDCSRMLDINEE